MKKNLLTLLLLAGLSFGQGSIVTIGGSTVWGDSIRWGDTDDSTSYLLFRGNTLRRDSSSTWVTTSDSCSKPFRMARGVQRPGAFCWLEYEVRGSSGNTDSTQAQYNFDTRSCLDDVRSLSCGTWIPHGRMDGSFEVSVIDSLFSQATTSGVTWKPTAQLFWLPPTTQARVCIDSYKAGGETGDSTFFRRHVVRCR